MPEGYPAWQGVCSEHEPFIVRKEGQSKRKVRVGFDGKGRELQGRQQTQKTGGFLYIERRKQLVGGTMSVRD